MLRKLLDTELSRGRRWRHSTDRCRRGVLDTIGGEHALFPKRIVLHSRNATICCCCPTRCACVLRSFSAADRNLKIILKYFIHFLPKADPPLSLLRCMNHNCSITVLDNN